MAHEKQTITKADVGTIDAATVVENAGRAVGTHAQVAAQHTESTAVVPIQLPGQSAVGFVDAEIIRGNYLSFPMSRSRRWVDMKSEMPSLEEYEPVLVRQKNTGEDYERIADNMLFRCFYVGGIHVYAQMNVETGTVLAAKHEPPAEGDRSFTELVEAVLLVFSRDGSTLSPVRCSFRNALATSAVVMNHRLKAFRDPEWVALNPDTAKYAPEYRRCFDVRVTVHSSRRNPGFTYPAGRVKTVPTTPKIWQLLEKHMSDTSWRTELDATLRAFGMRAKEISDKIPK